MPNKYLDSVGLAEYTGLIKRDLAPKASPAFTGAPTAPTPTAGDDSTKIATTEFVNDAIDTEITSEIAAEVTRADGKYLPFAGGTLTGVVNGVTPTAGDDSTKLATTEYVQEEVRNHANMPIGHEYFTMNPNIPQGSLPLFGGEYSRETYADLWAWVQQQTGYFITDSAWQAMANSQNGNVPFYSDGDGSTTFRVPSLKCWIKAANGTVSEVGSYLAAGLPNIVGGVNPTFSNVQVGISSGGGALTYDEAWSAIPTVTSTGTAAISGYGKRLKFDASRSNAIYGNANTVQPPSIVGMWLVKAYGVIVDTGQIDEQAYIDDRFNASKQYTDDSVTDLENTYLPANYLPLSGGTMRGNVIFSVSARIKQSNDSGSTEFLGGSDWNKGAGLTVYGKDHSTNGGSFNLFAHNGTNQKFLSGKPDGTLTWDGKNIERVNAISTNYIRYESGLQIYWDYVSNATSTGATITFAAPFNGTPKAAVIPVGNVTVWTSQLTSTNFKIQTSGNAQVLFIVIGKWK